MKQKFYIIVFLALVGNMAVYAGNPDRQGQAGASELLLNPWARSGGLHQMSTSFVTGVEAMRINIAGLSRIKNGELAISNNRLYEGTGINYNGGGIAFKLGASGALGIELASLNFGDIPITLVNQPAGTGGVFSPNFFQLAVGYSFTYANKISVGMLFRGISESIQAVSAFGFSIDAGVQYVSGPKDNFKLGISLRNVGSPMQFGGEGLTTRRPNPDPAGGVEYQLAYDAQAASFELPSMLNIGLSYDVYLSEENFVRGVTNFTSNAFSTDQIGAGLEFSYRNQFILRGGYKYDLNAADANPNVFTGFAGGATINVPFSESGAQELGIDYAYRTTNPFRGSHTITLRFGF